MAVKHVIEGVQIVPMGMANAFLIEGDDGLTLIDAGSFLPSDAVFNALTASNNAVGRLGSFSQANVSMIGGAGSSFELPHATQRSDELRISVWWTVRRIVAFMTMTFHLGVEWPLTKNFVPSVGHPQGSATDAGGDP